MRKQDEIRQARATWGLPKLQEVLFDENFDLLFGPSLQDDTRQPPAQLDGDTQDRGHLCFSVLPCKALHQ